MQIVPQFAGDCLSGRVTHTKLESCSLCCTHGAARVLASSVVLGTWIVVLHTVGGCVVLTLTRSTQRSPLLPAFDLVPSVLSAKQRLHTFACARRQSYEEAIGWVGRRIPRLQE